MSAPGSAPQPERTEDIIRLTTQAIIGAVLELVRALRVEFELYQRSAETFLGRVKGSLARSLKALQRAIVASVIAVMLGLVAVVVLAIFLVAVLNKYLGDPWGTGLTALLLVAIASLFYFRARSAFRDVEREAEALIRGP